MVTGSLGEQIEDRRVQDSIDELIRAENEPTRRATLIVLQRISQNLVANTKATENIREDLTSHRTEFKVLVGNFDAHVVREDALINRGKGSWTILAWVLTVAQAIGIYGWTVSRNEIHAMEAAVQQASLVHQKLESRLENLENAK